LTYDEVLSIVSAGGGCTVDGGRLGAAQLQALAVAAQSSGARLTIRNVGKLSLSQMQTIAAGGRGSVVFDAVWP
jgi:hypothetical protein